jgi:hypothetical protein
MTTGARRAHALLRRRKAKLDVKIARGKRAIKALQRKLRREMGMLSKRQTARRKM